MIKKKIGVIGLKGLPAFGGAAAVGESIINELKSEYDFTVYATKSHTDEKTGYLNGFYQIVFNSIYNKKLNTLYYYILSVLHAVFFAKYDLIHLHHRDAAFIMLLLKLKYNVMLTSHGAFYVVEKWKRFEWYYRLQEKYFVSLADIITCVSLKDKRAFKINLDMDVHFIPNGIMTIDETSFVSAEEKDYLFFGAGRIVKSKGCDVLLKALIKLDYPGKIIVAGDLTQTHEYKREVKNLSKDLNVEFTDLIKEKRILLSLIKNAKLFIYPSSREAMSIMLLEGASVKTPIICSDIIENKDVFGENEVLFFKTDSVDDLSKKILWALNNTEKMKIKAEKAYKKLLKNYLWSDISKKYKNIYDSMITVR